MRRAVELFDRAIALDSTYAAAWAGLADALTYLQTFGYRVPARAEDAHSAAERALALDPQLAEAHFALANLAHAERRDGEAVRRAERATELRPSYSDAFNLLSWIHKLHGRVDPGLTNAVRAVELDPLGSAPLSNLALAYLSLDRPVDAEREARRLRDLHPAFSTGRFLEALALIHQGRLAEAEPLLSDLNVAWAPDGPTAALAVVRAARGDTAAARVVAATIDPEIYPFSAWLVRRALGGPPPLSALQRIEQWNYWPTLALRYFFPTLLNPIRTTPEYPRLLRTIDRSWSTPRQ